VAFLAAYVPTAVSFLVGQAAFTLFVVVLFDLLQPQGWRLGLVRVEDIALGVGVSLVVAVLLWPRGARGQLRSALNRSPRWPPPPKLPGGDDHRTRTTSAWASGALLVAT
jgi:uncharacterized membrane protein YccC